MEFTLNDVFSSIHKTTNALPIGNPAHRIRFGEHPSRFMGQGPDFYQIVEYDHEKHTVNQIQWHLTDANGTVFVREAKVTKDFEVIILGDLSTSMMFRTDYSTKLRLLFETLGNIGLTCFHAQDSMGFIGFADDIIFDEHPKIGEGPVYHLLEELYKFFKGIEKDGKGPILRKGTSYQRVFEHLAAKYLNKHCFIVVLSDFIGAEELFNSQVLQDVASQHEIVFLFLDDPNEFKLTSWLSRRLKIRFGYLRLSNIETGEKATISLRKYLKMGKKVREKRKEARNRLRDARIDSMVLEYTKDGKHFERLYRFWLQRQDMIKTGSLMTGQ